MQRYYSTLFCRSLFFLLSFFFGPLCCLSFFGFPFGIVKLFVLHFPLNSIEFFYVTFRFSSFIAYHRIVSKSNTMCVTGEQQLFTVPERMSSPPAFCCVCIAQCFLCKFVDNCMSFCNFSSGHYIVCSSVYCI